jgi:hypothetical protein
MMMERCSVGERMVSTTSACLRLVHSPLDDDRSWHGRCALHDRSAVMSEFCNNISSLLLLLRLLLSGCLNPSFPALFSPYPLKALTIISINVTS